MREYKIERSVAAYSKIPDEDGENLIVEEFLLKPIEVSFLREIFGLDVNDVDSEMYSPYEIKEEHVKALQPYVIGGTIDLDKYHYQLECNQI